MTLADLMKSNFIDVILPNVGESVTYKNGAVDTVILGVFTEEGAVEEKIDGVTRYMRSATLKIADDADSGILSTVINKRHKVQRGSDVWSVVDQGLTGPGWLILNLVLTSERERGTQIRGD